jgi:hypothetical protein
MPPRPQLPSLSEPELRRIAKAIPFARAVQDLAAGLPRVREKYANNVLVASWDETVDTPAVVMFRSGADPFLIECTCAEFADSGKCPHANAAALAWVRAPETFTPTPGDFDLDAFMNSLEDEIDLFADDDEIIDVDDLLGPLLRGGQPSGHGAGRPSAAAAPAPEAVALTTTRTPAGELRAVVRADPPEISPAVQRAVLDHFNLNQLRAVAQRRGVPLSGVKRDAVLDTLATALSRPGALAALWPTLSPAARLVLAALPFVSNYLGVMAHQLQAAVGVFNPDVLPRLEAAVQELLAAGLLATTPYGYYHWPIGLEQQLPPDPAVLRPYGEAGQLRVVAAPAPPAFAALTTQLLLALRSGADKLRARPAPAPHPLEAKLPNLARGWPYFPGELEAIARQKSPQQSVNRYAFSVPPAPPLLTDAARATLSAQLSAPPEVIDFALHVLVARGLVRVPPGAAPQVDPAVFVTTLGEHPLVQALPLFSAYADYAGWTEFDLAAARRPGLLLAHPGNLHLSYSLPQLLADLKQSRVNLLHLLRRAPAGEWIDFTGLVVRTHGLNLQGAFWPPQLPVAAYLEGQPLEPQRIAPWRDFYGGFIEAVLNGPLHWQGLVDLGYARDRLAAFRLTELGAFLLRQQPELSVPAVAPDGPRLTFLPDGRLRLQPLAAGPELVRLLSLLGEVQVGPGGQLDYTLTAASVSAAFQAGWDSERLLSELAQAAGRPVPAALAERLRQWEARYGEVQLYSPLALVELADDYALTELLAGTSLARHLLYRFSPRLIAIRPEGLAEWRAELMAKGYTPRTEA